ncbi:Alpha/Beta hydrolase protein [Mycena crocata]|nr:Alpha/Beta hydrolase protein [Mycena crocata]
MAGAPSTLDLNLQSSYGVLLIGCFLSAAVWGISIVQTILYFLLVIDTANEVLVLKSVWPALISHWGKVEILLKSEGTVELVHHVWVAAIVATGVQSYYIWRIYTLGLAPYNFLVFGTAPVSAGQQTKQLTAVAISLRASGAATDILIAVSMVWLLLQPRNQNQFTSTQKMVSRLLLLSINSGAWTALLAMMDLICIVAFPTYFTFCIFELPLCSMYLSTLLVNLNARKFISNVHQTSIDLSDMTRDRNDGNFMEPIHFVQQAEASTRRTAYSQDIDIFDPAALYNLQIPFLALFLLNDATAPAMHNFGMRVLVKAVWVLLAVQRVHAAQVKLGSTMLSGSDTPLLQGEFFGGIPYAEPPVGPLRLALPVPKFSLGNSPTFDATEFGASCIQPASPFTPAGLPLSEDCLTINVFRPAGLSARSGVPVMAWIFGGSFFTGTPVTFNASELVFRSITRGTPMIYVSFNYRLGPLGFPQGPEAAARGVLNLGLRDQVLALQWVQQNIGAFGGDPAKVTVFGQSAGSVSVGLLYLNDNFARLARAAIFQSGQPGTTVLFDSNRAVPQWLVFANTACHSTDLTANNTFACLLTASADDILAGEEAGVSALVGEFPFIPVLDGVGGCNPSSSQPPIKIGRWRKGSFHYRIFSKIAGTLFVAASIGITSPDQIVSQINSSFTPCSAGPVALAEATDTLMSLYPDNPILGSPFNTGNDTFGYSSQYKRAAALLGDLLIQALRRSWAQTASQRGAKVYSYLFTDPQPQNPPFLGVAHLSELPYIYGEITAANGTARAALGEMMQDYWISFAASLDPNDGKGLNRPIWEEYGKDQRILQLDSTDSKMVADTFRQEEMSFIVGNAQLFSQ